MSLHGWFMALAHSPLGHAMQTSKWDFAVVEMVHLLALALLGGSVLVIDLRLLGGDHEGRIGVGNWPRPWPGADGQPGGDGAVGDCAAVGGGGEVLLQSGVSLEDGVACRGGWVLLHAASACAEADGQRKADGVGAMAAVISLALWLGVGLAGRAIGLL